MPIFHVVPDGVNELVKFLKRFDVGFFVHQLLRKLLDAYEPNLAPHPLDGRVHITKGDVDEVGVDLLPVHYTFGVFNVFVKA